MSINIVIRPRADDRYDIGLYDGDNGKLLLSSDQGYENVEGAEAVVAKVFDRGNSPVAVDLHAHAEPATLTIEYRNGEVRTERIR